MTSTTQRVVVATEADVSRFVKLHKEVEELNLLGSRISATTHLPMQSEAYGKIMEYLALFGVSLRSRFVGAFTGKLSPEYTRGDIAHILVHNEWSPDLEAAVADTQTTLDTVYQMRRMDNLNRYFWKIVEREDREDRYHVALDFEALE